MNQSAVILIESENNLFHLHASSTSLRTVNFKFLNNFPKKLKFLIYVEEIKTFDNLEIFTSSFSKPYLDYPYDLRYFEFFVINDESFVSLIANVLYSEKICGDFSLKVLNSYDIEAQEWLKDLENFNHFRDFHGCMLSFLIHHNTGPYWYIEDFKKYQLITEGFSKEIITGNQKFYGLTNEINVSSLFLHTGMKNFEGFSDGSYISLQMSFIIKKDVQRYSKPCGTLEFYYLITLNDFYNNYEKLLMPFDLTTWILLTVTFLLTFLIIFGTHKCPQWIQKLLFGEGIRNPAYNALGVMFGISQIRLLRESSNRIAFAFFIWFCLMFRTCYQSKLFEFMTSDMRKPLPTSIIGLIEMNYTVVAIEENMDFHDDIIKDSKSLYIMKVDRPSFISMYKDTIEEKSTLKYVFFVDHVMHAYLNKTYQKALPIMANERLTVMTAYTIINNTALMSIFDDVIYRFVQCGITKYLEEHAMWLLQRPLAEAFVDSRKILSLSNLEFGFVLWLASLSLPITCFLYEISVLFYRKLRKTIKDLELYATIRIVELSLTPFIEKYHDRW
ncbi:hypothetical protein PVAND_005828 [Polypedilum vanderplanki]|uniref:Ionotropic receptor n=1 Tax=Polypedilum vanderplanki TaxID=319348 RepID=A0A9J6C1C2_POLVA|nr:hypothetical protein PVAND_005828 [Polypedilum vanderplanki]